MRRISRRDFARNALVAATAAAVLPAQWGAAAPSAEGPPSAPALTAESKAEVEARISWIVTKYGARLDDQQRADIRRIITNGQPGVEAMRAYPLENATAPAQPFRIYRRAK